MRGKDFVVKVVLRAKVLQRKMDCAFGFVVDGDKAYVPVTRVFRTLRLVPREINRRTNWIFILIEIYMK